MVQKRLGCTSGSFQVFALTESGMSLLATTTMLLQRLILARHLKILRVSMLLLSPSFWMHHVELSSSATIQTTKFPL